MEQHPIPQNVTQYQFHLIGDMTIKQFVFLAGGIILAFITSRFPLIPDFIRIPIAVVLGLTGAAIAFVPFEERSLDVWLMNFIKAAYNPTQYIWKHQPVPLDIFTRAPKAEETAAPALSQADRKQLSVYLQTLHTQTSTPADQFETQSLSRISNLFHQPTRMPSTTLLPEERPAIPQPVQAKPVQPVFTPKPQPQLVNTIAPQPKPQPIIEFAPSLTPPIKIQSTRPPAPEKKKASDPKYLTDIEMPLTPDTPNVVVGMTITKDEHLIPNVILEIKDSHDLPIRAVKSNRVGQFFIATPLKDGTYTLVSEHPDYKFDTMRVEAKGIIIPPLKIVATETYHEPTENPNKDLD